MDLVQWVVARDDGGFDTAFAPSWADRMPAPPGVASSGRDGPPTLVRKSAPLVSRWLPHPLAYAGPAAREAPPPIAAPAAPGVARVSIGLALEGPGGQPAPLLPPEKGPLALGTLLSEYVTVVADLLEALGLPLLSLAPDAERRGLDAILGSVGGLSRERLAEQLCLLRAALEITAQSRGLLISRAGLALEGVGAFDVDGRLVDRLQQSPAVS